MRPIRCIKLKKFKFKYVSITEDSNRMVVRILRLLPKLDISVNPNVSSSKLLTTEELLNSVICIEDRKFHVVGEGVFDKRNRLHSLWWKPMANIQFVINPVKFNQTGVIDVISKRDCSFDNGEKSPDWSDRNSYYCLAQIYVRSANDSLIETAKSFPMHKEGNLYTNMNTARFVYKTEKDMVDELNRSKFLGLEFNLRVPKEVPSNSVFDCEVEIFRGDTLELATECDGDFWNLDSSAGYIPKRKIKVNKGKFSFKCSSLLVNSEDEIEIYLKDLANHVCAKNTVKVK